MTTNYLIATWSGKRRNPSKDYLKAQFRQLQKLEHNLTEITVIIPKGSDDPEYYDVPAEYANNWLRRPHNDRSYGQFLFACRELPASDYYFLVEDDYLPGWDNFDRLLIAALRFKKADFVCGSFGPVPGGSVAVPRHNIGVIRGDALRRLAELDPKFPPNGEGDGQEQEIFCNACWKAGVTIADYSDLYSVPYYDRYLRYFSPMKNLPTPFVPYQLLEKKAFGYHGEEGDETSHFLSTMEFHTSLGVTSIVDNGVTRGHFHMEQDEKTVTVRLFVNADYQRLARERIQYEARGREVIFL